jgi:hypothetical protein
MDFVNLTPHAIVVVNADGVTTTIAPSGVVARVSTTPGHDLDPAQGIPLRGATKFGEVQNLPEPSPGTAFVVSAIVLAACKGRQDVFGPDTGPDAIREEGQIKAVRRLIQAPQ